MNIPTLIGAAVFVCTLIVLLSDVLKAAFNLFH